MNIIRSFNSTIDYLETVLDDKIDENYDTKTEVAKIRNRAVEFKIKKNQKIIRFVAIKQFKNFLAKPEGILRLGVVTHITSKKKHK